MAISRANLDERADFVHNLAKGVTPPTFDVAVGMQTTGVERGGTELCEGAGVAVGLAHAVVTPAVDVALYGQTTRMKFSGADLSKWSGLVTRVIAPADHAPVSPQSTSMDGACTDLDKGTGHIVCLPPFVPSPTVDAAILPQGTTVLVTGGD